MIPPQFDYVKASSVDEATGALAQHGDEAKVLAGGQSLIPLLRLRLAYPGVLVDVTDAKAHGSGPKVRALSVTTGGVGEATEGSIVRLTATITQPIINDLPFGFIIVVNDGSGDLNVFVAASTGIDVSGLSPGQTIEVTGFSGQFADHFEVDPRFQTDIKVVQ